MKSYQAEWDGNLRTFKRTPLHDWASHGADAFRYLAMSWRTPIASEDEPSPLERLRQELKKPRTWNDIYAQRAEELRERGDELEEDADVFNLNSLNKKFMEMK